MEGIPSKYVGQAESIHPYAENAMSCIVAFECRSRDYDVVSVPFENRNASLQSLMKDAKAAWSDVEGGGGPLLHKTERTGPLGALPRDPRTRQEREKIHAGVRVVLPESEARRTSHSYRRRPDGRVRPDDRGRQGKRRVHMRFPRLDEIQRGGWPQAPALRRPGPQPRYRERRRTGKRQFR